MTIENFIQERKYMHNVSPKTLIWYGCSFKAFAGCLDSPETAKSRVVELRSRGVSATTVNTYLRCINAFWHWRDGVGEKCSPQCGHMRLPRLREEQKVLKVLQGAEINKVVCARPKSRRERRIHLLACLLLDTGLRINEALTLRDENIDMDNLLLLVNGKGSKERKVPFSVELRRMLFLYRKSNPDPLVFATRTGTALSQRNATRDFHLLCKKIGIGRRGFHCLRHTFACEWLKRGGDLYMLSRILGHTSISVTQLYLRSIGISDVQKRHAQLTLLSRR